MKDRTPLRLASRLSSGQQGLPAWLARRRLVSAARAGRQAAIDALWDVWLARADAELGNVLTQCGRPASGRTRGLSLVALGLGSASDPRIRAALVDAAGRTGHPVSQLARARIVAEAADQELAAAVCEAALAEADSPLAAFCVEHRIAPADPVQRAVFFQLTGQDSERGAADPDGALLALGYQAADPARRDGLRAALVAAGDVDLLRVVAGGARHARLAGLAPAEASYLVGRLAERRDWAGLWRLAVGLPVAGAVAAARLIGDDWRPAGDPDRALFELLARAEPDVIGRAADALRAAEVARFEVPDTPVAGSFSPDGRQLAVASGNAYNSGTLSGCPGSILTGWRPIRPAAWWRWPGRAKG